MQIQTKLHEKAIPEIRTVEPFVTVRIFNANSMKTVEPEQWVVPLRAETTMGVEGSYDIFITEVYGYSEKPHYVFVGLTMHRAMENYSTF